MSRQSPAELLSDETKRILFRESAAAKVMDFEVPAAGRTRAEHAASASASDESNDLATIRQQVSAALDRLDIVIERVLEERKTAEAEANRWITIVGMVVVFLVLLSAAAPFVNVEPKGGVLASVFSALSVAALLYMLYSPVQKRLSIADDRSNLVLMSTAFRLRFATARNYDDYADLARELTQALRVTRQDQSP